MRKQYLNNIIKIILEYYEDRGSNDEKRMQAVLDDVKAGGLPNEGFGEACKRWVHDGFVAVYYDDVVVDLMNIYGDDYDKSRYFTKDGNYKYRGGDVYLWTVYTNIMAAGVREIAKLIN